MAGFTSIGGIVDALVAGQSTYATWRKTPSQATTAGQWTDLSMSPGNPIPNYYASTPLLAARLNGGEGLFHGGNVSPQTKHLQRLTALTVTAAATPLQLTLCDYLLYYPFIDMGETAEQLLDNTVTLPRYETGEGVRAIAVEVAAQTGGQRFYITYTNQSGVSGRVSPTVVCNSNPSSGTLIQTATATNGGSGPYIPLQTGDTGIRSIQSLTMLGADVGLITLVLVRPLASMMIRGIDAPVEVDFVKDRPSLPRIIDGAYLNFIAMPNGTLAAAPIHGDITCVFN